MNKRALSSVMVCAAVMSLAMPVKASADDIDTQIQNQDQKITDLKKQRADLQGQISSLQSEIDAINSKAQELLTRQQQLADESRQLESEITALQERIEKRESAIQAQARDVQVNGQSNNLLGAVLDSDSLTDAVSRIQAMTTIVMANNDLVNQQKADKAEVENKQAENQKKMAEIMSNEAQLEEQKGSVINKQAELDVLTATLAAQQAAAENQKKALEKKKADALARQAALQAQQAQIAAAKKAQEQQAASAQQSKGTQAVVKNQTPPASNASGAAIAAYAKNFLGIPYVWGGTTPAGFDCSGLTSYVYAHFGKTIPRTSYDQAYCGTQIPVSQAQAGDLLLFRTDDGRLGHVALCIGGGQMIQAPCTGDVVKITPISSFMPEFAVRVK